MRDGGNTVLVSADLLATQGQWKKSPDTRQVADALGPLTVDGKDGKKVLRGIHSPTKRTTYRVLRSDMLAAYVVSSDFVAEDLVAALKAKAEAA